MKILFKCSWKASRDPKDTQEKIKDYCRSLARYVASSQHQVILTTLSPYNKLVAQEIVAKASESGRNVKDHLVYLLAEPLEEIPTEGRVLTFGKSRWRTEERTYEVQQADAVIAVGGGKGTSDCIQKAFLSNKPVFVACAVQGNSAETWKKHRPKDYHYIHSGDADFNNDVALTPNEFFEEVFRVLNSISEIKYPRRIFVVHGRALPVRDNLVRTLEKLNFEPVVLQREPSRSLTIIEKLERDTSTVGFSFVIYTPDDLGCLKGAPEQPRARQNVIFEHGLLMGLLGRDRTCALVAGGIEIPSDLHGVLYEEFKDLEEISYKVIRILKQAGYPVDANLLV
jgi:predicted nucleotide-binding protein